MHNRLCCVCSQTPFRMDPPICQLFSCIIAVSLHDSALIRFLWFDSVMPPFTWTLPRVHGCTFFLSVWGQFGQLCWTLIHGTVGHNGHDAAGSQHTGKAQQQAKQPRGHGEWRKTGFWTIRLRELSNSHWTVSCRLSVAPIRGPVWCIHITLYRWNSKQWNILWWVRMSTQDELKEWIMLLKVSYLKKHCCETQLVMGASWTGYCEQKMSSKMNQNASRWKLFSIFQKDQCILFLFLQLWNETEIGRNASVPGNLNSCIVSQQSNEWSH